MRKYERRETPKIDRALVDLRDERDHLNIQISLLNDAVVIDPSVLASMQLKLLNLDSRIAGHRLYALSDPSKAKSRSRRPSTLT